MEENMERCEKVSRVGSQYDAIMEKRDQIRKQHELLLSDNQVSKNANLS